MFDPAAAPALDGDGDGIADSADNCLDVANSNQADANGEGFGDACDADYDDDGRVGISDFGFFRSRFGTAPGPSGLACAGFAPCASQ